MSGHYVIVANVAAPDSCLRMGARVVVRVIPGDPANVEVWGLSRGGRKVTKWIKSHRLTNMRVAWEKDPPPCSFASREGAEMCIQWRFPEPCSTSPKPDGEGT